MTPRNYEAVATMAVSPPTIPEPTVTASQLLARVVALVESQVVAEQAIRDFQLGAPPRNFTAGTFLKEVLTVRSVPDTNLIRVVVRLDDPHLAANVANRVAAIGLEHVLDVSRRGPDSAELNLKAVAEQAAQRLSEASSRYTEFRRSAQIDVVKKDVATLLQERDDLKKLVTRLQQERARLASAEAELAKRNPVNELTQSIESNATLAEAARTRAGGAGELLGLETRTQSVNGVFQDLDAQVASSRAEIAALERGRAELSDVERVAGRRLTPLDELYNKEGELDRLDLERGLARKTYEDATAQLEMARVTTIGRMPQLQVVDAAVAPEQPVSRWVLRNAVLGLGFGLLVWSGFLLARESLRAPSNA
jgi:uncharacterized protein involved in exopolysaccharide biosynthesis